MIVNPGLPSKIPTFILADLDKIVKVYVSQSSVLEPAFIFFSHVVADLIDFVKYVDV